MNNDIYSSVISNITSIAKCAGVLKEMADKMKELQQLKQQVAADAEKVVFADAICNSGRSCLVPELAKILRANGVDIDCNRMFAWLRDNGYLGNKGYYHDQPTQKSVDMGLFEVTKRTTRTPDEIRDTYTLKVTPKGQIYFVNKFLAR